MEKLMKETRTADFDAAVNVLVVFGCEREEAKQKLRYQLTKLHGADVAVALSRIRTLDNRLPGIDHYSDKQQ